MNNVKMEELPDSPGGRLMQAFHEVRRNTKGFRLVSYLRTSELYMLHAIYAPHGVDILPRPSLPQPFYP